MLSEGVVEGIEFFLDRYVTLKPTDFCVVCYTPDSREPAAWVYAVLEHRNVSSGVVCMAPIKDAGFESRLRRALALRPSAATRLVLLSFEESTLSHDDVFRKIAAEHDPSSCLVFRAISACAELFSTALFADPEELSARNASILERVMHATSLRIKTESGSDLNVQLDNRKHRWISNRGTWRPGRSVILPAGEVATYPAIVDGVLVADFAFNLNAITTRDVRLTRCPVTVYLENGRARDFSCKDVEVSKFIEKCFSTTRCATTVGELGFGTNPRVKEPIALNSHINERRPGVHLGFGQHNQDLTIVPYQCPLHLDLIARGGKVWVDDATEPLDLERITSSSNVHPSEYSDEDVFSPDAVCNHDECCGVFGEMEILSVEEC